MGDGYRQNKIEKKERRGNVANRSASFFKYFCHGQYLPKLVLKKMFFCKHLLFYTMQNVYTERKNMQKRTKTKFKIVRFSIFYDKNISKFNRIRKFS